MTCFHPIVAFVIGKNEDGKNILKFAKKDERNLECYHDSNGVPHPEFEKLLLPCGRCVGCKMDRSREWSMRLMLERKYHNSACFVTLTYDDEHLPTTTYCDENGQRKIVATLEKSDLQKFMKRLRKKFKDTRIRFFGCGEYGSLNKRPHYHLILFGVDFSEDRYEHSCSKDGFVQYRSPVLEKLWDKGYSIICDCNINTCAYVARYCVKKMYTHNMDYQTFGIEPEFNTMSRRPGIGYEYFEEKHEDLYPQKFIYLPTNNGAQKFVPPKYFDRLLEIEDADFHDEVMSQKKNLAKLRYETVTKGGERDYFESLLAQEREFVGKISTLKRKV